MTLMTPLNILQIVQKVSPRLGFRAPTIAVTSQDLNVQIILAFALEEGEELVEKHDWNVLTTELVTSTTATQAQLVMPTDFARLAERTEIWNRSLNMKYAGPTDNRQWDELKSASVAAGYVGWWRILGGRLNIFPVPTAGQTLAFTYISSFYAQTSAGVAKSEFTLDSDLPRLSDKLWLNGIRWRYRKSRGLDYSEDMETYERLKETLGAHDRGLGIVKRSSGGSRRGETNMPTWPGTVTP